MKMPDTGVQPTQLPRQLCLWLLGMNKWTSDSVCRWGIFIQQQGCLRGQTLLQPWVQLLCARSSCLGPAGRGGGRG